MAKNDSEIQELNLTAGQLEQSDQPDNLTPSNTESNLID